MILRNSRSSFSLLACSASSAFFSCSIDGRMRIARYEVKANAANSEITIATEPSTGIGAMYGPIMPLTKAIGISAATTVKVARMVGLPTSRTASTATSVEGSPCISQRR